MGVVGMDKDLKAALNQGSNSMHQAQQQQPATHWMGSTDSMARPRPKTVGGIGSQDLLNIPPTPGVNLPERVPSVTSLDPDHPAVSLSRASSYSSLGNKSPKLKERPSSGRPRSGVKIAVPVTTGSTDNVTEL